MANTRQFDGEAAKVFSALATCPDSELNDKYNKLVGLIGRKQGAAHLIERQHGNEAKKVRKRLVAHRLI